MPSAGVVAVEITGGATDARVGSGAVRGSSGDLGVPRRWCWSWVGDNDGGREDGGGDAGIVCASCPVRLVALLAVAVNAWGVGRIGSGDDRGI